MDCVSPSLSIHWFIRSVLTDPSISVRLWHFQCLMKHWLHPLQKKTQKLKSGPYAGQSSSSTLNCKNNYLRNLPLYKVVCRNKTTSRKTFGTKLDKHHCLNDLCLPTLPFTDSYFRDQLGQIPQDKNNSVVRRILSTVEIDYLCAYMTFFPTQSVKLWSCYHFVQKEIQIPGDLPVHLKGQIKSLNIPQLCLVMPPSRRNCFTVIAFKGMFSRILGATCGKWPLDNS